MRSRTGLPVSLADMISSRRLRWLGNIARMSDDCFPKQLLFLGGCPNADPRMELSFTGVIRSGKI